MKNFKEEFLQLPWGKVAILSCGNPNGEKVLLVHGRLDSLATYLPLLKLLPDSYHYVAIDMPGNGKSDPFPKGNLITRFSGVYVLDLVVKKLGWKEFIYIGHSLGAEQGLFYTSIYPHRIKKAIYLDPGPSVNWCREKPFPVYFKETYENFYDNYDRYEYDKEYTLEQAVTAVRNNRALTEEEARLILSRSLIPVGEDLYRMSWDRRYKGLATFNSPADYYTELFTLHTPPSLLICVKDLETLFYRKKDVSMELMTVFEKKNRDVKVVWVNGSHDVHFTNPERFIDDALQFLNRPHVRSKV